MNPNTQPTVPNSPSMQDTNNPFSVMQPGERAICEIRRHPIGLFGVYIGAGLLAILAIGVAVAAPYVDLPQQVRLGIVLGAALFLAVVLLYTYVGLLFTRLTAGS